MAIEDRGFASMDASKRHDAASKGGKASGSSNKRGTAGKKSASTLSTDARRRGGQNSPKNG